MHPRSNQRLGIRFSVLLACSGFGLLALTQAQAQTTPGDQFNVSIEVNASKPTEPFRPIWRFFGYDEPNFTYMRDGQKLLTELSQLGPGPIFIRTHHLLTSGDGTPALKWGSTGAYSEDGSGRPVYDWTILDRIFDTWHERHLRPLVEVGFMPEALSIHPQDYPHHPDPEKMVSPGLGFSYPPNDYHKWRDLCFHWVEHCLARYGQDEVAQWRWEIWNEPNIFYWKAKPQEYHRLYDFAVSGIRRALPAAQVGGPHSAGGPGGKFLHDFLVHCLEGTNYATGEVGSPLDFVAFHAKGSPVFKEGHVQMGIANELQNIDAGFATVAAFPQLKGKPIIIGECDPEGCAACQGPQLGYRNGTMYPSYTAAVFARALESADRNRVNFEGALTWAFEFENQPYFAGFRALASNGIDLPVLNVFRMFGKMGGSQLDVTSTAAAPFESVLIQGVRGTPEISALATLDDRRLCILLWHYHDEDVPGPPAEVELVINGLPWRDGVFREEHFRIDSAHSNAFEFWKKLGSPSQPTPEQYAQLEKAGQLALIETRNARLEHGKLSRHVSLPRQAVSLLVIEH